MRNGKRLLVSFLAICLLFTCVLTSCKITREYNGKKIASLTYETVDYNGGFTNKSTLDFEKNKYHFIAFDPHDSETKGSEINTEFSDEEETAFLNACYTYGLFDLDDSYVNTGIHDGGGWNLVIEYEDGTKKCSEGRNSAPNSVFNNCATAFFDLCGHEVMGYLPSYYVYPPNISYSFDYEITEENTNVSSNMLAQVEIANYKWNKSLSTDIDIFAINEAVKDESKFEDGIDYQLVLYTDNYDCKERFKKITVKEYDYNAELSGEKIIYSGKWISQVEIDIELNKIYVYELTFKDGDYVQYTFSTYCQK